MSRMKNRKIVGINRKSKNRGRVGMLNKIHRLRSVGMDNGIATGFGILYVAEEAYPLIPYVRGNEHPLAFGRTPRLLSILFTTFVNTQNADYNGKTRTLTIGKDVRQVARRMGMLTGGCGRQNTVTSIIGYQDIMFTSRDGKEIKPIEETNIVQGESWNEKTITFTWEYVRLMSREPKEIPLSAVVGTSGGSLSLDLLVFATLYCPEQKELYISRNNLYKIVPGTSTETVSTKHLTVSLTKLNQIQKIWVFSLTRAGLVIRPYGMPPKAENRVQLIAE